MSPIRPERLSDLRRRLMFVASFPGVGRPLLELGTIQYARWLIVSQLPGPEGDGRPWRLNWSYLLFDATYDGGEEQYLRTFADLLPLRLTRLFGTCFGFESNVEEAPGSRERVIPAAAFQRFVQSNKLQVCDRHFFSARDASVATVRQALAIQRATWRGDRLGGSALGQVQSEVQTLALGPPATRPTFAEAALAPWRRRVRPARAVNPLVIAAPLADGAWKDIENETLNYLPDTHFARVVRMPATMQQKLGHPHPDRLERDYLLFSCDHDGTLDSYVTALSRHGAGMEQILRRCRRFPGVDDSSELRDWIAAHRLRVQYYVAGVPPRPVGEIRQLVQERERIARVATEGAAGLATSEP